MTPKDDITEGLFLTIAILGVTSASVFIGTLWYIALVKTLPVIPVEWKLLAVSALGLIIAVAIGSHAWNMASQKGR